MAFKSGEGNQLHFSVLSRDGLARTHLAILEILEHTGVLVESAACREMLHGAGARVDGVRVRIPSSLVENAIRSAPRRVVIGNRDGERYLFLEGNRSWFTGVLDCPLILDPYTHTRRQFATADYSSTAKAVDACPNLSGAGGGGNAVDYPPEVRAQVTFKYSAANMRKPVHCHPLDAQQMADIYDMAAVIAGDYNRLRYAPFVIATAEPVSPLSLFKDATEILLLAAERNLPVIWYPMSAAGATAPCSPAGDIAQANAEVLAGLVLHQLAKPGAPFIYGAMPCVADMRSTQWAYGSPDFALHVAASTGLAHYYQLPMFGTAGCTDAFAVDEQATAEATVHCLMSLLSGANLVHDIGLMAGGNMVSPEMIVLCDELIEMSRHATRALDTSPQELAVELIDQVGPQGNYLALDHTLQNFRRFWHSDIFLRNRLTGSREDEPEPVAQRIRQKTIDIIEHHQVDPLPDNVIKELDQLERKWMSRITP